MEENSPHNKAQLRDDLSSLGLQPGDTVLVHSSYKSIGKVDGGPLEVISAVIESIGNSGTILMPNLNVPHEFTVDNPPCFDIKKGTVRSLGIIPELFKINYAEAFSIHPTHSLMGRGPAAEAILSDHEKAQKPCGSGTPYAKLGQFNAKILLIGVDQRRNTTYHHIEELFDESRILSREIVNGTVILDGKRLPAPSRMHCWDRPKSDFNIINHELKEKGIMTTGKLGNADCKCIKTKEFIYLCMEKLRIDDKYFLIEK